MVAPATRKESSRPAPTLRAWELPASAALKAPASSSASRSRRGRCSETFMLITMNT